MSNNYTFPVGKEDDNRLKFQNKTLECVTYKHIWDAGLKQTDVVIDVGCGNGEMTCWFLDKVKSLISLDASNEQLNLTRTKVEKYKEDAGGADVEYVHIDITSQDFKEKMSKYQGVADFIFMRFVLTHIKCASKARTIDNLVYLLKSGGKLVSEEIVWDNICCSAFEESTNEYKQFFLQEAEKGDLDLNTGRILDRLYDRDDLIIENFEIIDRPITPSELKTMYFGIINAKRRTYSNNQDVLGLFDRWDKVFSQLNDADENIVVRTSGTGCCTCIKS